MGFELAYLAVTLVTKVVCVQALGDGTAVYAVVCEESLSVKDGKAFIGYLACVYSAHSAPPSKITVFIFLPIASITFTVTAFPAILYKCPSDFMTELAALNCLSENP